MIDYRNEEHRRETFLKFYEYHLKNRAHAGAVYYAFPHIFDVNQMDIEERLWFVFLNGCSQNVVTTYILWLHTPRLDSIDVNDFSAYFRDNYKRLGWDTDRRYVKNKLEDCILSYIDNIGDINNQEAYFNRLGGSEDKYDNFRGIWGEVMNKFAYFGRLSTFSYLEYLRIAGINLDCDQLFIDDIDGSKSHRNGLCKVLGRDDLDWTKDNEVRYSEELLKCLSEEGESLLEEARQRINHPDVSYFTLETTLCCYKGWHRVNRRYPNVYNDMFYDRIKKAESLWKDIDFSIFWDARRKYIEPELLLECNPLDKGLCKDKQNHYRLTGEVIMMEQEGFEVTDKPWIRNSVLVVGICGVGKTWVMKQLLKGHEIKAYKLGLFMFHETDKLIVVGKYDNTTFEGSDRLSMGVMADIQQMKAYVKKSGKLAIFEGDRFTNSKFIEAMDPYIIKIQGDGAKGREMRGSNQTSRHLKSITTRVKNIPEHTSATNSEHCYSIIKGLMK